MNRRLLLGTAILLSVFAIFAVRSGPARAEQNAEARERPNIIFLLTDDQRWDTLGCMGNPIIQTPNVDALAEEGVVFDRCFVTTSICATNRACILSGQYASKHEIWDFRTTFTPEELAETYPGQLKQAGYYLGFIGKWGVGPPPQGLFDYDQSWPGQNRYLHAQDGEVRHLTNIMAEQAIEFLDEAPGDRPFCLSFSFKSPHCQDGDPARFLEQEPFRNLYEKHPSQFFYDPALADLYRDITIPPAPLSDPEFFESLPEFLQETENRIRWRIRFPTPEQYQETVKAYYRLITGVDRTVGQIVEKLHQRGLDENTIIILTGDNGFYLGERGFAGKWFPHEVSIRVPLVVYDPRLPESLRGTRRDEMVLSIDLGPTMLAMADAPIPAGMQGRSLVPLLRGEQVPWRHEFFYEHLFEHRTIPRNEGVRTERYKYIRYIDVEPPYEELYDLENDPDEAVNLVDSPDHQDVLLQMRAKWESWRTALRR